MDLTQYTIAHGARRFETAALDPRVTTVGQLRAMSIAHFGLDPPSAKLLYGGKRLADDAASLESVRVRAGAPIQLVGSAAAPAPAAAAARAEGAHAASPRRGGADAVADDDVVLRGAAALAARDPSRHHGRGALVSVLEDQSGTEVRMAMDDSLRLGILRQKQGAAVLRQKRRRHDVLPAGAGAGAPGATAADVGEDAALRRALGHLRAAAAAFAAVPHALLAHVDNGARVHLDVAWLLFRIGDADALAEAGDALKAARAGFASAHGANLERLLRIKGAGAAERVLYVRLDAMEGVAAALRGDGDRARMLLLRAAAAAEALCPPVECVTRLLTEFGLTPARAAAALRATASGNTDAGAGGSGGGAAADIDARVHRAAAWAFEERERAAGVAAARRAADARAAAVARLGPTANGSLVHSGLLEGLTAMGFPRAAVVAALQRADNDEGAALEALTGRLDDLMQAADDAAVAAAARRVAGRREQRGRRGGGGGADGDGDGTDDEDDDGEGDTGEDDAAEERRNEEEEDAVAAAADALLSRGGGVADGDEGDDDDDGDIIDGTSLEREREAIALWLARLEPQARR